jgi:hypothetical protein
MITVYIFVAYATWTAFRLRIVFNFRLRVWLSCGHGMVVGRGGNQGSGGNLKKTLNARKDVQELVFTSGNTNGQVAR